MTWNSNESYRYEVLEYLDEGGSGRVYKAFRYSVAVGTRETVALKFLKTKKSIQEIIVEYSVLQNLRSKYVVRVYGVEKIDGQIALVMEYIDGITWHKLFCYPIQKEEKYYLFTELRKAILDLNEEISFHGDLSPKNVMIDTKGRLRLIDFGNHYGENRLQCGTPDFISDHVLNGEHHGAKTDLATLQKFAEKYKIEKQSFHSSKCQKSIGRMVSENIQQKTIILPSIPRVKKGFLLSAFAFCLLFLLFIPIQAKPPLLIEAPTIHLSIVTTSWKRISMNGKDFGFTPIHLKIPAREIKLDWEDGEKKGQIHRLPKNGAIHLRDKDFIAN
jgi:serine/threonine protein kinase